MRSIWKRTNRKNCTRAPQRRRPVLPNRRRARLRGCKWWRLLHWFGLALLHLRLRRLAKGRRPDRGMLMLQWGPEFDNGSRRKCRMARPVILFSQQWTDLPLEQLTAKASEWGYQGLELACSGDHFEVSRAVSEDGYCQKKLELLSQSDLGLAVLSCHGVSQAVCDPVDRRHRELVPEH